MSTHENYAKQIKNAKRHIEKREKTAVFLGYAECSTSSIKAGLFWS